MILPTPRLAAMVLGSSVAVVVSLDRPDLVLTVVNLGILLAALADAVLAVPPRTVDIRRLLPPALAVGQEAQVEWSVRNTGRRAVRVRLADELPPSWRCPDRRARLFVAPGRRATVARAIHPARRGRFPLSEVTVRTVGPLGLAARQGRVAVPGELRVRPAFPSRAATQVRVDRARAAEIGARTSTGRGGGTEFDALRDYQVDDDVRRLDWAATARAGKPVVRTYRAERNQNLAVVVDTGRLMAATVEGVPRLEHALDAVQALAAASTRLGDRFALWAHDHERRLGLAPGRPTRRAGALADALCELQPHFVETDHWAAFAAVDGELGRRSLVMILTELSDEGALDDLVRSLALWRRRHLVVVGAVTDPLLRRWVGEADAADEASTFRAAAAIRALEARRAAVARVTAAGATCVDDVPRRLTLRLVDTYLDAKAAGRV